MRAVLARFFRQNVLCSAQLGQFVIDWSINRTNVLLYDVIVLEAEGVSTGGVYATEHLWLRKGVETIPRDFVVGDFILFHAEVVMYQRTESLESDYGLAHLYDIRQDTERQSSGRKIRPYTQHRKWGKDTP